MKNCSCLALISPLGNDLCYYCNNMRNNWLNERYREKHRKITRPYCVTNKHKSKEQLTSEWSDSLNKKYKYLHSKFESKIEGQEQYSRRTILRFHNIKVPVDETGNVKHPVNTDELILNVCNDKLGLDINLHDIGRSHIIGI